MANEVEHLTSRVSSFESRLTNLSTTLEEVKSLVSHVEQLLVSTKATATSMEARAVHHHDHRSLPNRPTHHTPLEIREDHPFLLPNAPTRGGGGGGDMPGRGGGRGGSNTADERGREGGGGRSSRQTMAEKRRSRSAGRSPAQSRPTSPSTLREFRDSAFVESVDGGAGGAGGGSDVRYSVAPPVVAASLRSPSRSRRTSARLSPAPSAHELDSQDLDAAQSPFVPQRP